jgi:hypothetical protein
MKFLPQTRIDLLRLVVIGSAMGCIWFAVIYLQGAIPGRPFGGFLSLFLWLPLAAGLWLLKPWARSLALVILVLIVVGTPFAEVSGMAAVDGDEPPLPIWEQLMYRVVPLVIPAMFFLEVLYAYGCEFQRPLGREDGASTRTETETPTLPRSWLLWCLAVVGAPALLVAVLNLRIRLEGGCLPPGEKNQPALGQPLWMVPAMVCVALGLLLYLRAIPSVASRPNKIIRATFYTGTMLLFYGDVSSYLEMTNLCAVHLL